jgi:hypothetical protein
MGQMGESKILLCYQWLVGISSPGDNPSGLRSALCGATFSATLAIEIDPTTFGR